jgi:hypothetical protein
MANGGVIFAVGILLAPFFVMHVWLAARGATTLDALRGHSGLFDAGTARNLRAAFGPRPELWLWPGGPTPSRDLHGGSEAEAEPLAACGDAV